MGKARHFIFFAAHGGELLVAVLRVVNPVHGEPPLCVKDLPARVALVFFGHGGWPEKGAGR